MEEGGQQRLHQAGRVQGQKGHQPHARGNFTPQGRRHKMMLFNN